MAQPLFHVAELFDIRGRGLVVAADIPVSKANFKLRIGDAVEFVRSDGSRLRTVVRGIEMVNPYNPDRSFAFLVGEEVAKSDIERGAEVWQVQAAMALPPFAIGEWLVCPRCGIICDAPFRPAGSDATEPELVLGASLPESGDMPSGQWRVEVAADCPACGSHLVASAVFEGCTLREFLAADPAFYEPADVKPPD